MADSNRADSNREIPTKEEIEQRAYEIYVERGQTNGRHMEDWIEAEKELYERYFESKAKGHMTDGHLSARTGGGSGSISSGASSSGSSSSRSRETESTQKPSAYAASATGSSAGSGSGSGSSLSSSGSAQGTPNWQAPSRTSGSSQGASSSSKKEEEVPDKKGNQRAGYKE